MTDEITNYLTISGPADSIKKFREKAIGPGPLYRSDEIIKGLFIRWGMHDAEQLRHVARSEKSEVLQFQNFIPIPKQVLEASFDEKGYDWEIENWGVKWGAIDPETLDDETDSSKLVYKFRTAWLTPKTFFEQISRQFPNLLFSCEFFDVALPHLHARIIEYENGQLRADRLGSSVEHVMTDWVDDYPVGGYVMLRRGQIHESSNSNLS